MKCQHLGEDSSFTLGQGNSVALAVQQPSQLLQVADPLDVVLDGGGLHEEGVHAVLLPDPVDALLVAGSVHRGLGGLHEGVDLLVGGDGRALHNQP